MGKQWTQRGEQTMLPKLEIGTNHAVPNFLLKRVCFGGNFAAEAANIDFAGENGRNPTDSGNLQRQTHSAQHESKREAGRSSPLLDDWCTARSCNGRWIFPQRAS
jgi:hypothetical protein